MKILFITGTRIGDAVLSSGLLGWLLERYPEARVTVALGAPTAALFTAVPRLDRLIIVEKRRWKLHWPLLWREVFPTRWDLVVDLRGSALSWLLRTGERRVMAKGAPTEHRVKQLARLFDLDPPPAPRVWIDPRHEEAAAALVPQGSFLALAPIANWRGKQWRVERFAELAVRLTGPGSILDGAPTVVVAAAHERPQLEPLLRRVPRVIDLIGRTEFLAAAAVIRRSALFVGNDSGLMHVAAALGAPTLGLFGPGDETQYAPYGARCETVRTTLSPPELMGAPGFDHRTTETLMDTLSVDAAEAAARRLWSRLHGAAAAS